MGSFGDTFFWQLSMPTQKNMAILRLRVEIPILNFSLYTISLNDLSLFLSMIYSPILPFSQQSPHKISLDNCYLYLTDTGKIVCLFLPMITHDHEDYNSAFFSKKKYHNITAIYFEEKKESVFNYNPESNYNLIII